MQTSGRQFQPHDFLPHISAPQGEKPVALSRLTIDVEVSGLLAETTQEMVFHNPNSRVLEGELTFPLPDGAVVCGYALDVEKDMVEGVIVPKQEARRILEAEERKGADPGIVEQVQGNLYRTRIYPFPAGGTRTIRLTYVSDLTLEGNGAAYHLPLAHAGSLDSVSLRVEIKDPPVEPRLTGGIGNLSLTRWEKGWVAEARLAKGTPTEDLQVRLPELPDHFTQLERCEVQGEEQYFFCSSSRHAPASQGQLWSPRRVALAWDASGSRSPQSRELELLAALLERWQELHLHVVVFRDAIGERRDFAIEKGDSQELLDFLKGLPYDGGTDLASFDFGALPHPDVEAWLLCSDGLSTLRRGLPHGAAARVLSIHSQARSNSAFLRHIAEESGGLFVNLLRTPPAQAAQAILEAQAPLRVARTEGCSDIQVNTVGGRLTVSGKLDVGVGYIELSGPGAPKEHLALRRDEAAQGRIIARAWAGQKAQTIGLEGDDNNAQMLELGRNYGLVTPGTSLLVLESLEQYLEYDIKPPASLPHMVEAFLKNKLDERKSKKDEQRQQLEYVLDLWRQRVTWWETDHHANRKRRLDEEAKYNAVHAQREQLRSRRPLGNAMMRERTLSSGAPPMSGGPPPMSGGAPPMPGAPAMPAPSSPLDYTDVSGGYDLGNDLGYGEGAPGGDDDDVARMHVQPPMAYGDDSYDLSASMAMGSSTMRLEQALLGDVLGSEAAVEEQSPSPKSKKGTASAQASIQIQAWNPDTPYLKAMQGSDDAYAIYLQHRSRYDQSPSFFLDCGDFFLNQSDDRYLALRVLSNLVELGLDDVALMRMYAWRLQQAEELDLAIEIFEQVKQARDDEPQSFRDLGLALGKRWEIGGDPEDATRAMELLYQVLLRKWDRFPEIEIIALMELNRLLHKAQQKGIEAPKNFDSRLLKLLDLDVRISLSWDADMTDVDLHVFEPTGEHAYYSHNRTEIGGLVSRDFRQGYGPEEYVLRKALPGDYKIKAHYYGSHQQTLFGACTVIAHVFTNYGRDDEQTQVLTLRLEKPGDDLEVGTITIDASQLPDPPEPSSPPPNPNWQEQFRGLTVGMTINEITALVGQPTRIEGDESMLLLYHPEPGVELQLRLSPKLQTIQQLMDGAALDLLP